MHRGLGLGAFSNKVASVGLAAAAVAVALAPSSAQNMLPVCPLITTGGTIASKIDAAKKAPVPVLTGEDLVATVPGVSKYARVEVNNLFNLPSDYMDASRWSQLTGEVNRVLARPEVAGVVISQGTDTLEETAYWLDLTVNSEKPVVLIGAQRNASESDFDGPRNLLNAIRICVDAQSRDKGVMLAMNSHINAARDVTKTQTSSVETFKSSEFGFLGVVDFDRIVYARTPLRRQHIPIKTGAMPYVEIVAMYGGADGHLVKAAIDHGAEGIVPRARLGKCELADVHCDQGGNCQGYVGRHHFASSQWTRAAQLRLRGGGKTLVEAGAVMGDDLSPQKARILLMLLLQSGAMRSKDLQAAFDRWFDSRAEAAGRRPATAGSA